MALTLAEYLSPEFLEVMIRAHRPELDVRVLAAEPFALDSSSSILATLAAAGRSPVPVGLFGVRVTLSVAGEVPQKHRLVLKLKPSGAVISAMLGQLAARSGGLLAEVFPRFMLRAGFGHTHRRELAVYETFGDDALLPHCWGLYANDEQGHYALLLEYLDEAGGSVALLRSVQTPAAWTDELLRVALTQLADWHARHLNRPLLLTPSEAADEPSRAYMVALRPLWEGLIECSERHAPDLLTAVRAATLRRFVEEIPDCWSELEAEPKTLVHNDLNPRNACFRMGVDGPQLCAYDWELATHHVPPYDTVELLAFTLTPDRYAQRLPLLEHYRQALHARTGLYADPVAFRRLARLAARDFGLRRLGMYLLAHAVNPYPFLPRVVASYFNTLAQLGA